MKKILLLFMISLSIANVFAQYNVILKVVDNQDGALTNNVDDNNESNVFCWAGSDSGNLYDGDWWYPMYDGESGRTGGELIKSDGVWTWQCTFDNVASGDYRWNPHMKTLGWASINNLYTYAENADLYFTVAEDGTVSGQTTLELPLTTTAMSVTLDNDVKVYSQSKKIIVVGIEEGANLSVYNLSGKLVKQMISTSQYAEMNVNTTGIYLVIINQSPIKVFVK